ncbi:MAG: acylphosphatase [Gammaproteobacteria bacterium]|nr:acylphosphatase [Gammaproteobacteria bacterium]
MEPAAIARRARVTGRVQGVFFRASTAEQALRLGLRGYAANRPDGSVEVLAVGAPQAVAQLLDWLWQGPPTARVIDVTVEEADPAGCAGLTGFARG